MNTLLVVLLGWAGLSVLLLLLALATKDKDHRADHFDMHELMDRDK